MAKNLRGDGRGVVQGTVLSRNLFVYTEKYHEKPSFGPRTSRMHTAVIRQCSPYDLPWRHSGE